MQPATEEADYAGHLEPIAGQDGRSDRAVPDAVRQRFQKIEDAYYFPDRTLAFRDHGNKLVVRTHNLAVVHGIVAIAQARGWEKVKITGTLEFRRTLWQEATKQGIDVEGYRPDELELRRSRKPEIRGRDDAAKDAVVPDPVEPARPSVAPPARRIVEGELLAHGAAPYRFDAAQRLSYYATLNTDAGERTIWGSDLERALTESRSQVRIGDRIVLREGESQQIKMQVPVRNAEGALVGDAPQTFERRGWSAETAEFLTTMARKAKALQDTGRSREALLAEYPDLAGAALGLRVAGEYAKRITTNPDDQNRIVHAVRNALAEAVARGATINPPSLRSAERQDPRGVEHRHVARRVEDAEQARS